MQHKERGSFTIEALLALPIFMFAFITIASLAMVARVEGITQYAIDQVAKEVSRYCYVADRANLLLHPDDGSAAKVKSIDEAVGAMMNFVNDADSLVKDDEGGDLGTRLDSLVNGSGADDFRTVTASAKKVYDSLGPLADDPKGAIVALAKVTASKGASALISRAIAQPLCKKLVQPYLTSSDDVSGALEKLGIEKGLDGLDFSMSTFLMDGRTINVVLFYTIKVDGFGIFDQTVTVKQTASTAAWVKGTKLSELPEKSFWKNGDLHRGKAFVAELKEEKPHNGVKGGVGVDLYDQDTNTFTTVNSINVFSASYSDYSQDEAKSGAARYFPKEDVIKAKVKSYATELNRDIKKIGDTIEMDEGTKTMTGEEDTLQRRAELILVVPEETGSSSDWKSTMNRIASEVEQETGVKVKITYRDKALTTGGGT